MDEQAKQKIAAIKILLQNKSYKEALDDLCVLVYKYPKLYQIHLMAGLAQDKLNLLKEAEESYIEVLDLKPNEPNALRSLTELYQRRGDVPNYTKYLQITLNFFKGVDDRKYRETLVKLVNLYKKQLNLEKIDPIFLEYTKKEKQIGDDFVSIADAHFRVSVENQCFNLQKFELMGTCEQCIKSIVPAAKEPLNTLLIDVCSYFEAASITYKLTNKDTANCVFELRASFPQATAGLMLILFNEFMVAHNAFSPTILTEIYRLLLAYYSKEENTYLNMEYLQPEIFSITMILSFEYLTFFKEFFTLDELFTPFLEPLSALQDSLMSNIREDYKKKAKTFILRECRLLTRGQNVEQKLEAMKKRIQRVENSYLEEVIAKMAMNCFTSYQKLNDMKNLLKVRIRNLKQNEAAPHLYKYYYDYLLKIGRVFKILDEEIAPLSVLEGIILHEPTSRYIIEKQWLQFCQLYKGGRKEKTQEEQQQIAQYLENIQSRLGELQPAIRVEALRKVVVIKLALGDRQIEEQLREAVQIERSFPNLQSLAFYLYHQNRIEPALLLLKEAFVLCQTHYHANLLIVLCLYKLNHLKEIISFLSRIRQGFTHVFWVNYLLAISKCNERQYLEAEPLLTSALQNYSAPNHDKSVVLSHDYSAPTMIQQNNFILLYDEIVFSSQYIHQQMPILSNIYFKSPLNRIALLSKMGELMKILGRTKSALDYNQEAYLAAQSLTPEEFSLNIVSICLLKKEYATVLFYMRLFKESEQVLTEAFIMVSQMTESSLQRAIDAELKALSFEICVERLSFMMKFQSHEHIQRYVALLTAQKTSHPSANFLKNKYQFHILIYLHKQTSLAPVKEAVEEFLHYFGVRYGDQLDPVDKESLSNGIFEMSGDNRQIVRECMEDYQAVKYLHKELKHEEVMPMMQLFPRSTIFCILYGMTVDYLPHKTAAFLKCLQIDRDSPISVDLLASLYLKQKNYLAACKLFLKSLQLSTLNPKCYIGLAACLFCLILRAHTEKQVGLGDIIRRGLIRINSYMQYLRTVDPSQDYHMLKFLKLLLSKGGASSFECKYTLQSNQRDTIRYKQTILRELLEDSFRDWQQQSIWTVQGQEAIIQCYIASFRETDLQSIIFALLRTPSFNSLSIATLLALKDPFNHHTFTSIVQASSKIPHDQAMISQERRIKEQLFHLILAQPAHAQHIPTVQSVFPEVPSFKYIAQYNLPSIHISRALLAYPACPELRRIHHSNLISKGKFLKKGKLSYRCEMINQANESQLLNRALLRKLVLLYRDTNAYISLLALDWRQPEKRTVLKVTHWLRILNKLEGKAESQREKIARLKIEMQAYLLCYHPEVELKPQKEAIFLVTVHKAMQDTQAIAAAEEQYDKSNAIHQWALLDMLSHLVHQHSYTPQLHQLLTAAYQLLSLPRAKDMLTLIRFISVLNMGAHTEEQIILQAQNMEEIVGLEAKVSNNTKVLMASLKYLLAGKAELVGEELLKVDPSSMTTYSDQVTINYLEVLSAYHTAQSQLANEDSISTFTMYVDSMAGFVRDPFYTGFFLSLKGMISSLMQQSSQVDPFLKRAILFSPMAAKSLLA